MIVNKEVTVVLRKDIMFCDKCKKELFHMDEVSKLQIGHESNTKYLQISYGMLLDNKGKINYLYCEDCSPALLNKITKLNATK
jgi:hypothetical protein